MPGQVTVNDLDYPKPDTVWELAEKIHNVAKTDSPALFDAAVDLVRYAKFGAKQDV